MAEFLFFLIALSIAGLPIAVMGGVVTALVLALIDWIKENRK